MPSAVVETTGSRAASASSKAIMLKTVDSTSLIFQSDIDIKLHPTHKCGIIHATKIGSGREEHTFVWLTDKTNGEGVEKLISHLAKFGYWESRVRFIPYSSLGSWMHRYPNACELLFCSTSFGHYCINIQ